VFRSGKDLNMSGKLYNAACYCRLSQDDANDGTSVSIITQKEMLRDYCVKSGYSIHDFYCDDGYTGTNFDRPAFQRMYEDAKSGLIDIIVVKDLSRFGRNQGEVRNNCFNLVAKLKIRMIFVSENLDSDDEDFSRISRWCSPMSLTRSIRWTQPKR